MRNVLVGGNGLKTPGKRDEVSVQVPAARTADLWTREQPYG
ncbi:MAG: hypothetical protein QOH32_279 [Bradyrhizobium sp.]|jgi:hypothetical protein|nr:hypothetical protein [Bradyrhizobium sp.]